MTWVVPLALGGFAILLMATFTMLSARRRHHAHVSPVPTEGPRVLVHDINDDRCTGCDACVAVCPTNVLDLVSNKSRVLRFQDCIQCEACMFACPTEALVMYPEGGLPPPLAVPEIDENFQTAVPGQYLIGEVAGKPLVKSAANLGRAVVEHAMASGLRAGALGRTGNGFDVVIVGSGPGGLSAALTCVQRGLSYVVLEKEQLIASTIARYPKGKLVMAEPYDTQNLSLLPVFDSSKEQLVPIWEELIERVGVKVHRGESVELVQRGADGVFEVRTTVAVYRAQRVVLSIGTRGKPRTLQVPGENLPKVRSLLEDPDDWRGKNVLVVGGGDSACEAALALADAGAKVIVSYRGKGFNRAAPKNKTAIEAYAAEGRVKTKLGSQVIEFDPESVVLALGDGSQKRYPNDGAFVLIGADPPVAWLEKMGVQFVQRPHQHQMGKTDDILRRFLGQRVAECPEDAARAAAQILGGSTGHEPRRRPMSVPPPLPLPARAASEAGVSGPRKWLRSATSIFSGLGERSGKTPPPVPAHGKRRLESPIPLSELTKSRRAGTHSGDGRRDALSAGERTRILRMLRDEGGRIADEESQVFVGAAPSKPYDLDFDDEPAPPPMPSPMMLRPDVPAKPAVVVGLDKARRQKKEGATVPPPTNGQRSTGAKRAIPLPASPPPPAPASLSKSSPPGSLSKSSPPGSLSKSSPPGSLSKSSPPGKSRSRAPLPKPFDEPTRAVESVLRDSDPPAFDDLPTRLGNESLFEDDAVGTVVASPPKFMSASTVVDGRFDHGEHSDADATRVAHVSSVRGGAGPDERTQSVDIRGKREREDGSMSDVDWDID